MATPSDEGEEERFDPKDYAWEFQPPGIQDVQRLVDIIHNNSDKGSDGDGNDSDEEGHVKRISNKFFVYRSHFLRAYVNVVDPASGKAVRPVPQRHISKLAGHVWKEVLTEREREPYHLAYLQLKAEFEAAHPDYRYRPKTKEERDRMREKQKEKRAAQIQLRKAQRKEREIEDNRRRVAAGYSHRAWRKLKKAVKNGMPDPLADIGGCLDPNTIRGQDSDDEHDGAPDFPEIGGPALPVHLTDQMLQAVQLLEQHADMRASQAWQITAPGSESNAQPYQPSGRNDYREADLTQTEEDSAQLYQDTERTSTQPRSPFSESSSRLVSPLPHRAGPEHAGPWYGMHGVPPPSFEHRTDEMYAIGPVRQLAQPRRGSLDLLHLEQALIASTAPETPPMPPPMVPRKPAIEFGRTDPSQITFSAPTSTASAKRRMVMYEGDAEPMSIRDEPADPVRGIDRDEDIESATDAVRSPGTPDMSERMAPSSSGNRPFQVIPVSFRPRVMGTPGGPQPDWLDRGRRPSSFAIISKADSTQQLGAGLLSWGKGKRRLSPDAQGGRSRQPSLAFGLFSPKSPTGTSRSRQPSMVVGLVNGTIKLIGREELERLETASLASPESTAESSGTSLLSEPSDAITELLASASFDAEVTGADIGAAELLAQDQDGKHVHAYHWLGASLASVLEGVKDVDARLGPRMSFSEFISSLPEHMAPDPEALQALQDQLNEGLVDAGTYDSLLQYSGWSVTLDDVTF